jgi:hypothetical protein
MSYLTSLPESPASAARRSFPRVDRRRGLSAGVAPDAAAAAAAPPAVVAAAPSAVAAAPAPPAVAAAAPPAVAAAAESRWPRPLAHRGEEEDDFGDTEKNFAANKFGGFFFPTLTSLIREEDYARTDWLAKLYDDGKNWNDKTSKICTMHGIYTI